MLGRVDECSGIFRLHLCRGEYTSRLKYTSPVRQQHHTGFVLHRQHGAPMSPAMHASKQDDNRQPHKQPRHNHTQLIHIHPKHNPKPKPHNPSRRTPPRPTTPPTPPQHPDTSTSPQTPPPGLTTPAQGAARSMDPAARPPWYWKKSPASQRVASCICPRASWPCRR